MLAKDETITITDEEFDKLDRTSNYVWIDGWKRKIISYDTINGVYKLGRKFR